MVVGLYTDDNDAAAPPPALAIAMATIVEELDIELYTGDSVCTDPVTFPPA